MLTPQRLGLRVVVIAFAPAESLAAYQHLQGLDDLLVLSDPGRDAYYAFGFDRASMRRVWLDPRVWRRYGQLIRRGRRVGRSALPQEDTLQLGGDVLLDGAGQVAWVHRSRGPEDRPSVAEIQRAVT